LELQEADRSKNEFLSVLSHELRNPLASISAGLQLLEISNEANHVWKAKEIMKRQVGQLYRLVNDLLDLTRITHNKIELKKERTDLNRLAYLGSQDHKPLFDNKGVILETWIGSSPINIDADPVRITQIIGNLLHNALKFTEKGGKTTLKVEENGPEAVICVKDTGIGIKPDILKHLFEPFTQEDTSLDRRNGGLGLGLSIVKGITELHGGSVSVSSEGLGKGSCFCIRLPLPQTTCETEEKKPVHANKARSLRILLIEDNRDFSDIICSMFQLLGHEAIAAFDGAEGLQKAAEFCPEVIFCDIGLPGMDGFEVARRIRSDTLLKDVCLIALTGYAGESDIEYARESGFDRHIVKPVEISLLQQILSEVGQP
jgi:CheY-like chemotaxis protein/two-component sensor histidine kinase